MRRSLSGVSASGSVWMTRATAAADAEAITSATVHDTVSSIQGSSRPAAMPPTGTAVCFTEVAIESMRAGTERNISCAPMVLTNPLAQPNSAPMSSTKPA